MSLGLSQGFIGFGGYGGYIESETTVTPELAYFDGSDTHLYIKYGVLTEDFRPHLSDFTTELWFKTGDDVTTDQYLQSFRGGGHDDAYWIYINGGKVYAAIDNDVITISVSRAIEADKQYYLAATYDRDANLSLYLAELGGTLGSPVTVDISSMSGDDLSLGTRDFGLGAFCTANGSYYSGHTFMGYISEFRYSDTLRDPQDSFDCNVTFDANHIGVWHFSGDDWLTDVVNGHIFTNINVTKIETTFSTCDDYLGN